MVFWTPSCKGIKFDSLRGRFLQGTSCGVPSNKRTWLDGKWTLNEDVFPIEHGDIPASYVSWYRNVNSWTLWWCTLLGSCQILGLMICFWGDLQNFEASKSVDICWPWPFRRNLLANLITLHKHQTSASFMDKTLKIWEPFKLPENKHVETMKASECHVAFSFCWSGSNCWHCYRLDTPRKIYSWNPNMEIWKMTFPFQFGDFLGSSRQFSALYWLADLKYKRQIAPQISLPHHQLSL